MSALCAFLAAIPAWLAWRQDRATEVERYQQHEFLLKALTRLQANSATEAIEAEMLVEELERQKVEEQVRETEYAEEISKQNNLGFYGDIALGRAVMLKRGYDPDNSDQVERWNGRHGGGVLG